MRPSAIAVILLLAAWLYAVTACTQPEGKRAGASPAPASTNRGVDHETRGRPLSRAAAGRPAVESLPDAPPTEYTVHLGRAFAQIVGITMTVRDWDADALDATLPVWRPGRYVVLDPAGSISGFTARDADTGSPLGFEKIDKTTWRVATRGVRNVAVSYDAYANSIADRTRHVDDSHAFLSPSAVFTYTPGRRGAPVRVRIEGAPSAWRVATGLKPAAGASEDHPLAFVAPDYDTLVDSPLEIGLHETLRFDVDGTPHEFVVWTGRAEPDIAIKVDAAANTSPHSSDASSGAATTDAASRLVRFDRVQLPKDIAAIVRVQRDIFGGLPYERYVYLVHAYPGGSGGTEHLNSTVMQTPPTRFDTPEGYRTFLGLVSHEMFHTWNVKQLRPADLKPYDYARENYTRLLWVAEGMTTYYSPICLVRAGLMKPDDYLKSIGDMIDGARRRPGEAVQSAEQSSFDAWVVFSHPSADSGNSTVSFYDKGAQLSLALDLSVRAASGNSASLDTVLRDLYRRFPLRGSPGYTTDDLLDALERAGFTNARRFHARHIRGVERLDFETILAVAGLEVIQKPNSPSPREGAGGRVSSSSSSSSSSAPKPLTESGAEFPTRAYLGFTADARDGLAAVTTVQADGPAYAAGLIAGDLIVSLNGVRFRAGDLDAAAKRLKPGAKVRVTILRYDLQREIEFSAAARPDAKWTVQRVKTPTASQRAIYESWLGQPWPAADAKPDTKPGDAPSSTAPPAEGDAPSDPKPPDQPGRPADLYPSPSSQPQRSSP